MITKSEPLLCPLVVEAALLLPFALDGAFPFVIGDAVVALPLPLFFGSGWTTSETSSSSSSTTMGDSLGGFRCLVVVVAVF